MTKKKKMSSRRPHRNSHHGCRECKERRVKVRPPIPLPSPAHVPPPRHPATDIPAAWLPPPPPPQQCDETQPRCQRCQTKNRPCTYTHLLSTHNPFPPTPTPVPRGQQPLVCHANRLPHGTSPNDAATFHHHIHIAATVSPSFRAHEQFWRWDASIRLHAPTHDYLYYAALAHAALHRSRPHTAPSPSRARDVALACTYQSAALARFAPAVAKLHASGGDGDGGGAVDAILTCASMILASAFIFPPAPGQRVLDQARQVLALLAGTVALYDGVWDAAAAAAGRRRRCALPAFSGGGDIGAYVQGRMREAAALGEGGDGGEAEVSLGLVEGVVVAGEKGEALLLPAVRALRVLVRRLAVRPGLHTMALHWAAEVPGGFAEAVGRGEGAALVVLAHWAACLAGLRELWWVSGWGARVVRAVVDEVCGGGGAAGGSGAGGGAGRWRECLEWPMRVALGVGDG